MKKHLLSFLFTVISFVALSQITITSTVTNVSCYGLCTGSASITASGGTAPYTYWATNGANAPVISNLCAGQYTIHVLDAASNEDSISINITQPIQLNVLTNSNPVLCFGTSTGTIYIAATGGIPSYSYNINGASYQSSATFSNVPSGIYAVGAKDSNGCITSNTVQVTQPTLLTTSISALTNVSCNGYPTGDVSIIVTGGTGGYSHLWSNGITVPHATNLFAGIYTYTVTDTNGCSSSQSVSISQPTQINATSSQTNITCNGACNGSAMFSGVSGGVAPYTYYYNSSSPQSSPIFNNLCPGSYTLTVLDANNCQFMGGAYITQPSTALNAVTSVTNANCGQSDGSICASITGGTGSTTIVWNTASTALCNNLVPAGLYTYTVTDSNGCSVTANKTITSIGGPSVSITNQTNVSCFGLSNGSASAIATGGIAPYTYTWTQTSTNSPTLSLVTSGIYNVVVADAAGCVGTQSVVITQPSQLLIYTYSNPECGGGMCNGSINANVNGGTAPYAYTWSTGATTANYLPGLCAGMYSVQVTDMMGCVATQTAFVNQTQPITITPSYTNVSCGGSCDGTASMGVMGGTPGYAYYWTPNVGLGSYAPNLCAGTYTLVVTDGLGCLGTNVFTISNSGLSSISNATLSTLAIKETCLNSGDGNIDLTITGTNPGPFTYHWNNGATSQDVFNLNSNIYSVTVFDAAMNCLTIQDTITADGTNCGVITGNVFIDNNTDCIKNSGDINFSSALVVVNPGNRYGYTNAVGDYTVANIPFGSYSTSLVYSNNVLIPTPTCSTTITTTLNSGALLSSNNDFSIGYNSYTQPDMQVWGYSSAIVPGFIAHLTYQLSNLNNVNGTGLFKVVLPNIFTPNITTVSPNTYTLSGDTVIWNFSNITFTSGGTYFGVDFYVPVGTTLGSIFSTCMYAEPNITDLNYASNNFCYSRTVAGSFDPNDKTVSPVGLGANGDIAATETDLTYLIRFQNTGNGPAVNIVVKDTLSPNVDINTFEMLGASHNYNIDILPGNILRWKFNNIMLADSGSNETASHGYIQYRIKRTNNNTPGTQIKNTAYIYFDFNAPVVTNTAINTIETVTGIKSSSSINDEWNVYPNPSTGVLYIVNSSTLKEASQIQVINSIGQTVLEETITSNSKNMDLSKLNNGVYFVKIVSEKQSVIKRVVLSK